MGETKKFFGGRATLGAFLVIFTNLGVCSTLGVFIAQLAEYSGWSLSACVIIGTINTIVNMILSLIAIPICKKIGYRWTMLISIIACAFHVQMYCFAKPDVASAGTLVCFYIGGALASVAIAFGSHAVCSGLVAEWYLGTHKREKMTSYAVAGAGLGAAVWVFFAGQLFRFMDWKSCYRVITIVALIIGIIAIFGLIRTPKQVGQEPMPATADDAIEGADASKAEGVTHKEALKSASFWLLIIGLVCSVTACSGIISYAAAYWQGMGMSPTASSNWTAGYLLISFVSLLIAGRIFKKIKGTGYTVLTHVAQIVAFILLLVWGANPASILMVIIIIGAGISYPIDAAFPTLVAHGIFGPKAIAAIIGTLMVAMYGGQLISSLLTSALLATPGGFTTVWTVFIILSVIGAIVILLAHAVSPLKKKKA